MKRKAEKPAALRLINDLINEQKGREIFRGQTKRGWPLLPKALRDEFKNEEPLEALENFRRECSSVGYDPTRSLQDLAVAQHYGLATTLLDWTTKPLVALFFACWETQDSDGEVFVLNKQEAISKTEEEADNWQKIESLRLYNPRLIDRRITQQKGLFTVQGLTTKSVNELVKPAELKPIEIPARLKTVILEILYVMGVDRSTLFPDADGLCARINWETKNRKARNFPPVSGARTIYLEGHAFISVRASGNLTVSDPSSAD